MQAMMVASSFAVLSLILPPVNIVSLATVALVTLRRGEHEGLYVLISACLFAAIAGFFLFGGFQFGLILWPSIWLISILLRVGKSLSIAIEASVLLGVAGVIGFYLFVNEPVLFWNSLFEQNVQLLLENGSDVSLEELTQSVQVYFHYMTGVFAAGTVCSLLFGLILGRWWQAALYNPGGFREEYLSLRVHSKVAIGSILIVAIAWLASGIVSEICWNIAILFIVLYTIVGSAILHATFSAMKTKRFMVPFLYITLVLIPHMIAVVIIVGVIDAWLDLRSKISNNNRT